MVSIKENTSLKQYNTFGIDVNARQFASISNTQELVALLKINKAPLFVLSGGSNMLLTKDIDALVVHINSKGIQVQKKETTALVTAQAGENWHNFVQYCITNNLGGIENLSLIPGCVGSSPIQNIGAYGVEIKDTFVKCKALDIESLTFKEFTNEECKFGYRDSIFKNEVKGKYIITEVTFKLTIQNHVLKTDYGAIKGQLDVMNVKVPTIKDVANAVIEIRRTKLPNPKIIGNSGSFFKNPIISIFAYQKLVEKYPLMPHYPVTETKVKVPAGWLIDQANFKGITYGNAGVHTKQALVLVNKTGNCTGKEIIALSQIIISEIKKRYGIVLETEVNIF